MTEVFLQDLNAATRYTPEHWRRRSWREKLAEVVVNPIRSQL
jgi:cardiolipin synthase